MSFPLISIIIPVYNAEPYLAGSIQSVLAQDYPSMEIIVVDDGSTDGSAGIAKSIPQVKYVHQANQGDAAARNRGVAESSGEYIAFLDADDQWLPGKLKTQMDYHLSHLPLGYTLTQQICFLEDGVTCPNWLRPQHLKDPHAGGLPTLVAHRSVLERVGPFNTALPIGSDMDWLTRAKDSKIEMAVIPKLFYRRRVHGKNLSHQHQKLNDSLLLKMMRESIKRQRQHV